MGLVSRLWKKILALFKRIAKRVAAVVKKYWWIIAAVLVVWFAPQISAWLISVNAPSAVVAAVQALTPASGWLTSAGSAVWSGTAKLFSSVGLDWATMGFGTKAAVVAGACFVVAPEETESILKEVTQSAGKALADGAVRLPKALGLGSWWLIATGVLVFKLIFRREEDDQDQPQEPLPA